MLSPGLNRGEQLPSSTLPQLAGNSFANAAQEAFQSSSLHLEDAHGQEISGIQQQHIL